MMPEWAVLDERGTDLFLNAAIIKAGYATPITIPPNEKYTDLFKSLYEEAKKQRRGLWKNKNEGDSCNSDYECTNNTCNDENQKLLKACRMSWTTKSCFEGKCHCKVDCDEWIK